MSDEQQDDPDQLVFYKDGEQLLIKGVVDGETVFYAEQEAVMSDPVVRGALRAWGTKAYPDIAARFRERDDAQNGGAFQ